MASAGTADSSSSTGTTACSARTRAKEKDSQSQTCGDANIKPSYTSSPEATGGTSCTDHGLAGASNLTPQTAGLGSDRGGQEEEGPAAEREEGKTGGGGAARDHGYWWHVNKGGFPVPEHTWERMWSRVIAVHPDGAAVAEAIRGKPCRKVNAL